MKRILSIIMLITMLSGLSLAQNSTGGQNYYDSLVGNNSPALTSSGEIALVWVDMSNSNDGIVDGLTSLGYTVTVAISSSDFNNQLQNGNYVIAVLCTQSSSASAHGVSLSIVNNYIASGGSMIFTTWTPVDEAFANLFEASITPNSNLSTVTITDPALASGLTNPFSISNAGWGVFSIGLSAIGGGEVLATYENSDAAIIRGNGGRTLMVGYLSDAPPAVQRQPIIENVATNTNISVVPIPLYWFVILFVLLAVGVIYNKRRRNLTYRTANPPMS